MKLIVHAGTGTIIPADECLIVTLPDEDLEDAGTGTHLDDHEIVERAEDNGLPVSELLSPNIMAFSPLALREEARELLGGMGYYEPDDTSEEAEAVRWCAYIATDDELNEVGAWILNDDDLWTTYRVSLTDGLKWGHEQHKEQDNG